MSNAEKSTPTATQNLENFQPHIRAKPLNKSKPIQISSPQTKVTGR